MRWRQARRSHLKSFTYKHQLKIQSPELLGTQISTLILPCSALTPGCMQAISLILFCSIYPTLHLLLCPHKIYMGTL
jgi:hypothetical protein